VDTIQEVKSRCDQALSIKGLTGQMYQDRLAEEIEDLGKWQKSRGIDKAGDLLRDVGGKPASTNQSGSLCLFLLGLSTVDPVQTGIGIVREKIVHGSCPDIDTDFDPRIRDEIKKFVVSRFGQDNVCSIGSYQTYKTRAVILDVVRALGHDVSEAMDVTKVIDPLKSFDDDDEGGGESKVDDMDFDDVCKHYEPLRLYFEKYPDVREHVEILRNQVKNMGKHAAGMIISDRTLKDMIPVLYDSPSDENRQVISAWAESGSNEELSSVGLVKVDLLGLCLAEDTLLKTDCGNVPIRSVDGVKIAYLDRFGAERFSDDFLLTFTGEQDVLEIEFEDGTTVSCSPDHQWFVVE